MSDNFKNLLITGLMLLSIVVISAGSVISWNQGIEQLHSGSRQQLDQFIDHLASRLARFEFVPQLIAKNQLLVELLNDPENAPRVDIVNHFLQDINQIIGASDSYLMDAHGLTLAASNWQDERPFVGKNFSFRPYFTEAMQGRAGRYFALGTTSEKRGYYFSYPIIYAAQRVGVMVVKMDLSNIEQHWSGRDTQFIVTDPDGVTFISTRPQWLYRSLQPLAAETRRAIRLSQRYQDTAIRSLDYFVEQEYADNSRMVVLGLGSGAKRQKYLAVEQSMPEAGWTVVLLSPLDKVGRSSLITAANLLLLITLVLSVFFLWHQRYKRRMEKERDQMEAQKQLEHEVSVRTADLRREVDEHKRTEQTLRDTQGELIQTAKLAVLGQMSASISHELNNPLAAIRSYADNARQFLTLQKDEQVDSNLERIAGLTEQMGKISSQLKFFARKSSGNLETVRIQPVIQSAIELVSPQYKHSMVNIELHLDDPELSARADIIQLEQVIINLINNAMNAMEKQDGGNISIHACRGNDGDKDHVIINVDDEGPGIQENNLGRIFDPFFTTRKSGLGLGLSISARIMDNMKGSLSALNRDEGGARFTITLLAAKTDA